MPTQAEKSARFLASHRGSTPLLQPNVWDPGTARLFESLGFEAVATRAENLIRGDPSLDDTIARLQRDQEAGASDGRDAMRAAFSPS